MLLVTCACTRWFRSNVRSSGSAVACPFRQGYRKANRAGNQTTGPRGRLFLLDRGATGGTTLCTTDVGLMVRSGERGRHFHGECWLARQGGGNRARKEATCNSGGVIRDYCCFRGVNKSKQVSGACEYLWGLVHLCHSENSTCTRN